MAKDFRRFIKGILLKGETADASDNQEGSLFFNSTDSRVRVYQEAAVREFVTADQTQTLTNKTIDADNNTISNLRDAEIASDADIVRTKLAPGTADHVLINDASGEISSEAVLAASRGGTGQDFSAATGLLQVDSGTISAQQVRVDDTAASAESVLSFSSDAARTYTFPNATDTVVLVSETQALANKSFSTAVDITDTTTSTSSSTGALTVAGGAGIGENLHVGGELTVSGDFSVFGTTTFIDTTSLNVADANITINSGGNDLSAEGSGISVERAGADGSLVYEDALASKFKAGVSGSEIELANVSSAQTLTNKTIDADNNTISNLAHGAEVDDPSSGVHGVTGDIVGTTDTQDLSNKTFIDAITLEELAATPSNPASGDKKLYAKDDGRVYTLDSAGNEIEVGSGAGSGVENLFSNGNFESPDLSFVDGFINSPEYSDGDGGSFNTSWERTQVPGEVQAGTASLKIIKSAFDTAKNGVSFYSDTIDLNKRGKRLFFQIQLNMPSAYVSGDLKIIAFDLTNGKRMILTSDDQIDSTKTEISVQSGSKTYIFAADTELTTEHLILSLWFDTDSNVGTAYNFFVDDIVVNTSAVLNVPIVNDWIPYTPTGTWTQNTIYRGFYRRVGDTMDIQVLVQSTGAPNNDVLNFSIPSGFTIDVSKLAGGVSTENGSLGTGFFHESGVTTYTGIATKYTDATSVTPVSTSNQPFTQTIVFPSRTVTVGANDELFCRFSVPIAEWSSQALVSTTELAAQTVKARARASVNQSVNSTAPVVVNLGAIDIDNTDIVDLANNRIQIKSSGTYLVNYAIRIQAGTNDDVIETFIRRNSASVSFHSASINIFGTGSSGSSRIIDLNAGDLIDITVDCGNDSVFEVLSNGTFLEVTKLPDFTIFGAYQEKNKIQTKILTGDVINGGVISNLTFNNLVVGKWYEVTGQIRTEADSGASADNVIVTAVHNSINIARHQMRTIENSTDVFPDQYVIAIAFKFKAEAVSLTFEASSVTENNFVAGNGSQNETYIQLEERNDLIETTEF